MMEALTLRGHRPIHSHDYAREREIRQWEILNRKVREEIQNLRRKLSKDHDGGSDPERTLRHRPIHGHGNDHAR